MDAEQVASLQEQVARSLFEAVSGAVEGWKQAEFKFEIVGGYAGEALIVDGDPNLVSAPIDVGGWLYELRAETASPSGPWFTCAVFITSVGEYNFQFEYEAEPEWSGGPRPSLGEYERDLEEFPRSQEDIPSWFPEGHSR
ncbi:hypothetical protein [Tsukamurella strandjordii]|uniref:DUF600 family protein n=1 Tax=Tsukamurella strandjordii TaxID=147577 RepID=A0AA90N8E0_9ACTN|nr:hypothetical protein [Tsukamurella strandjordii]MDP0396730.1 hypothetical protein [Tsukamurella strandjordii]